MAVFNQPTKLSHKSLKRANYLNPFTLIKFQAIWLDKEVEEGSNDGKRKYLTYLMSYLIGNVFIFAALCLVVNIYLFEDPITFVGFNY